LFQWHCISLTRLYHYVLDLFITQESNIGATFGGHWNGGDRSNVNNWLSDDGVKTWSQDARRVPKTMYEHVSSRSCVEPYLTVPSQLCTTNSDCDTGNSCKIGKCDAISGACSVETIDGCCGNGKCEAGKFL
jgi:Cys-rich repeat protein